MAKDPLGQRRTACKVPDGDGHAVTIDSALTRGVEIDCVMLPSVERGPARIGGGDRCSAVVITDAARAVVVENSIVSASCGEDARIGAAAIGDVEPKRDGVGAVHGRWRGYDRVIRRAELQRSADASGLPLGL